MKKAQVFVKDIFAGELVVVANNAYYFEYLPDYDATPISLTMPTQQKRYEFNQFPPFFEGLLPEGGQLEALLRKYKLDKYDYFGQLVQVGNDLVGAVTVIGEPT